MGTKGQPSAFDCYADAEPNEPLFTLLGRDAQAPALVREWAKTRAEAVSLGKQPKEDAVKVAEAYETAARMERFRTERIARGAVEKSPRYEFGPKACPVQHSSIRKGAVCPECGFANE